ncbi:MAG: DUF3147 family protein [Salinivirgaceae bacterium]|nr:DUF3147 family protein [Salinivirgaceae bacterium]MDD4745995.1 DUF3147 family protein [Salinivirgaceae bacterium]MDY0281546.1 DUF3147 family protein [Salinivirgaceae bacterium]
MGFILLNAALSFVIAGTWISLATWGAERLGSKIGGVLTLLPSTILVSLLFVAITSDNHFAAKVALTVPLGMTMNTLFLFAFVTFAKKGLAKTIFIALMVWAAIALVFSILNIQSVIYTTLIYGLITIAVYIIMEHVVKIKSVAKQKQSFNLSLLFTRALFSGTIVALTVILSGFVGHFWTGILSTFPAVMLTSMVILTRSQGIDFARATAKTMILASGNIVVYAFAVNYLYQTTNLVFATILSFLAALLYVIAILPLLSRSR